ncbi:hypothetical protein STEG23_003442, partial [Scotinomys teguina]
RSADGSSSAREGFLREDSMSPEMDKKLDIHSCFVISSGYKPEHGCLTYFPLRVSQKFTGHLEQIRAALIIQEKEVGKNKGATGSQDGVTQCNGPSCPGIHIVDQAALHSQRSVCLYLLNAGIKDVHHYCLVKILFYNCKQ